MLKKLVDRTFWKFILVGVVNTLFGTAVMFLCYNLLHLGYWISSGANYVLGSILSYFLNKYFTFQNREKGFGVVLRFTLNILVCYLLAYGIAKPAVAWALSGMSKSVQENGAILVGMCLFVGFNYLGQRFFAFREKKDENQPGDH